LKIVHVDPWWQLIAIGFQIRPMRQCGSSVAWTKSKNDVQHHLIQLIWLIKKKKRYPDIVDEWEKWRPCCHYCCEHLL
jgi:hypothetical protein